MTRHDFDGQPVQPPLAELERHLIDAYLAGAGYDYHTLITRQDDEARRLLREASAFASARLSEVEARLRYLENLHGEPA